MGTQMPFSEELSDLFSHLDECRLIRVHIVDEFHSLAVYWWNFISLSFDVLGKKTTTKKADSSSELYELFSLRYVCLDA